MTIKYFFFLKKGGKTTRYEMVLGAKRLGYEAKRLGYEAKRLGYGGGRIGLKIETKRLGGND